MFPDDSALLILIEKAQPYIIAVLLGFTRISAILQIFPLFTQTNLRGQVRAVFALVLTVPIVPMIHADVVAVKDPTLMTLGLMIAKEFLVGNIIGTLLAMPFWGVQTAGDIIDFERSASAANLSDPVNASEQSLMGTILLKAGLAVFIMVGGLQMLITTIYDSYAVLRPMQALPDVGMELVNTIGQLLSRMFLLGVIVAGPVMIALAVIDISLVFASRIAKQIPVYDFSILIKNLCVAVFVPLYSIFLSHYFLNDWREMTSFVRGFLRIPGG